MKVLKFIFFACIISQFTSCKNNSEGKVKEDVVQDTTLFNSSDASLVNYEIPEWYKDAKIGYWATWGVYSVPAYAGDHAAEWYGRWMYTVDDGSGEKKGKTFDQRGLKTAAFHKEKYGDPAVFGYKDFIPMFKAEKWNADEWANLFEEGGAKFFVFMAMHHDNFCLWDSETQPYNSVKMGPKRDFTAEMKIAVKKKGMHFGVSNHSAWNGSFFEYNHINGFDGLKKENQGLYGTGKVDSLAIDRWWKTTIELADKYQPDLYYFDWGWNLKPFQEKHRRKFLTHYYNKALEWGKGKYPAPNVVVNYKNRAKLPVGSAVLDLERGGMKEIEKELWQNDTSLGLKSWSYAMDEEYRSANQVVDMLMDIISKNGVLLLNIGPKADGSIPHEAAIPIKEIGAWLKINGEAVYATRPWEIFGEGPTVPNEKMHGDQVEYTSKDIRFTKSKDDKNLFVTFLGWPSNDAIVTSLKSEIIDLTSLEKVTLLSNNEAIKWNQKTDGLHFYLPQKIDKNDSAYALKLEFKETVPQFRK
ncbi:alpha-L-fucosidase [Polaribacter sp. Q13]|uniref:alpha-L-fucosidase n=1 Tax=Polaribacter sp. Q13 TaxID=2806551 RepID=UPI00193C4954|nr:alpha-L-fucosidase [Polaribacter sp. Q13]QVY66015.1 alpha-L-fucosidase [Polaribacter sp. Q13]